MSLLERSIGCLAFGMFALSIGAAPEPLKTAFGPVPPLSFRTSDGRPAGFTIDVFDEASRREGVKLAWMPAGPSLEIETSLKQGLLDIVPAGMITPDRQRMFYVSKPWWFAELSLLTRAGVEPGDLAGKRLALETPIFRFLAEKQFPGAIEIPFTNATEAAIALCRGRADGALMMHMNVHDIFFARHDVCQNLGVNVTETSATQELAIIARREMEVPASRLRRRIDEMALDGTLARLAARYPAMPASGAVKLADDLRARYSQRLWRAAAGFVTVMLAAGIWLMRKLYRDVGERRVAQAALELSQARLARAHRIASLGDWEVDLVSGNVDLSEGARALFSGGGSAASGGWDTFLKCVAEEDLERVRTAFGRAAEGQPIDISYAVNHPERGQLYVRQNAEPLAQGSYVTKVVGTIQDMTDHRQLEMQLSQSQKMESIGVLAGGVAHDFNNLLTVISGYAVMLLDELPPATEEKESVEEIARAADRAGALTRQLLMFSRRQMTYPKVISLNEVLQNLEKMLRRLIGEDIELVFSLSSGTAPIYADAGQIEQVVMNLAVNARDAMPNGGKLIIQTANRQVDESKPRVRLDAVEGNCVELNVTDTGTGIPPEILPRIFEPFFTTKERGKGTGLGLSTVYGIVRQNGGAIQVHSEPGKGSSFVVLLPTAGSSLVAEAQSPVPASRTTGNETILVVEDEDGVRKFIREILGSRGYRVLEARNGREALDVAAQHAGTIDLLLTDVIMPEMGGGELAERFAKLRPGAVIVYMSGYSDRAMPAAIMERVLHKPFTPSLLLRRIRESLPETGGIRSESAGAPGASQP